MPGNFNIVVGHGKNHGIVFTQFLITNCPFNKAIAFNGRSFNGNLSTLGIGRCIGKIIACARTPWLCLKFKDIANLFGDGEGNGFACFGYVNYV